jgi:hypothetical protein
LPTSLSVSCRCRWLVYLKPPQPLILWRCGKTIMLGFSVALNAVRRVIASVLSNLFLDENGDHLVDENGDRLGEI